MQLADLGAEVIKVENPGGDYVRKMAFPIVDGISLLHWHLNRGKQEHRARSAQPRRASRRTSTSCAAPTPSSRPCGPARWRGAVSASSGCARSTRGSCFCTHLRLRHDRPVQGHAEPRHRVRRLGRRRAADVHGRRPADHPVATPPSASTRDRSTPRSASARPSSVRAPRAAAAASRWRRATPRRRSTGTASRATRRTSGPRTRSPATTATARAPRRPVGDDSMKESVRYQYYRSRDGLVLFMASEREFWKNFCDGIGRPELFDAQPGRQVRRPRARQRRAAARAGGRSSRPARPSSGWRSASR